MTSEYIPSSLIEFSIENYKCFKNKAVFSLATRKNAANNFKISPINEHLLKSSIIFGPNASGKSTLFDALIFLKNKIKHSTEIEKNENLIVTPFLLDTESVNLPTKFEVVFLVDQHVYHYYFALNNKNIILQEELKSVTNSSEKLLISRNKQKFNNSSAFHDPLLEEKTRKDALYLSVANQWNNEEAQLISNFFKHGINGYTSEDDMDHLPFTSSKAEKDISFKQQIIMYLKKADFSIENLEIVTNNISKNQIKKLEKMGLSGDDMPTKVKSIFFSHLKFDMLNNKAGEEVFHIKDESSGTQSFYLQLGPILNTLSSGSVLFIDEFNSKFHPDLCLFIIELFHSKITNPKFAQLIVTSHDLLLLKSRQIDRDQFWFTEKDKYGKSRLFSLSEYKERKGGDFLRRYSEGRYGAWPFIERSFLNIENKQ